MDNPTRSEFSHHGEECTFETLLARFAIADKALQKIGEMVHDADLGDGKFHRPECLGLDRVLKGWAKRGLGTRKLPLRAALASVGSTRFSGGPDENI